MSAETRTPSGARPENGGTETTVVANRYAVDELLGRGSMGAVYRARDVVLDRPVALKLFPAEAADPQHAVRYEQEARLLARLSHPGLVTVYDAGIDATTADEPKPYLVMELVRGPTLADRLRNGPLPQEEVAALCGQLASALAHIHRRGVVHRDVKPANVLLRPPDDHGRFPTATLTDFGIARLIDGTRITMTGYTLGTANYLSPEQVSGAEVAAPSDIYSLGLVVLECLTGEIAYPGHGLEAALPRLHHPPMIPDSVPSDWAGLLRAMTDIRPTARPDAGDIATVVSGLTGRAAAPAAPQAETADEPMIVTDQVPVAEPPPPAAGQLPVAEPPPAADQTRVLLPAAALPGPLQPPRRRSRLRPSVLIGVAAAVLVLIVVIALASSGEGGAPLPVSPSYPSVGGQLGGHLRQLQQDVSP